MTKIINFKKGFLKTIICAILLLSTIFVACNFFINNSYAGQKNQGLGRVRICNANGVPESLHFDGGNGGRDSEFVLTNPVCLSVIAYAYSSLKISLAAMNYVCNTGSGVPRLTPSLLEDSIDIAKGTASAINHKNLSCAAAVASTGAAYGSTIAMVKSIHEVAQHVYHNSQICGSNWIGPNTIKYVNNTPLYKKKVQDTIEEYIEQLKTQPDLGSKLSLADKTYREWYYNGVEVEDNPSSGESCYDVTQEPQIIAGNKSYPKQKYYLRGLETGNFNCKRYQLFEGQPDPRGGIIDAARQAEFMKAFECCQRRAKNSICIEYDGERKFCNGNSRCEIKGIYFETNIKENGRLICAQTYSLCPYNFFLGGGTEICDYFQDGVYDNDKGRYVTITSDNIKDGNCASKSEIRNGDCTYNTKAGKCKNYCQYMKHCTITNDYYQYRSAITSPYFSSACLNFVGDSQNQTSYDTGFIAGSARHFSAPITQCIKETLENVFYNKAGHSSCLIEGDSPDSRGICSKGNAYKKGDQVKAQSFFTKIQKSLTAFVKIVLTLSIVSYGLKTLVGQGQIKAEELFMYIIKIGLVMYFATGDAWQTMFFDGVYNSSTVFAQMVFKIQTPDEDNKRDGCQFGRVTDSSGVSIATSSKYPKGKEYLALFDTLDCKIARYLGFGPESSTANIALLIAAGWATGTIGLYFSIALLMFGIILISLTLRTIHIFTSSFFAILLMVYLSPLAILASLFSKTNGIFKGWTNQLISYSLQPMILFAYIAIFISVMDKSLIGSATFYGNPPHRYISCKNYCSDSNGKTVDMKTSQDCSRTGDTLRMPNVDSFACMITNTTFDSWPGLELIGISVPFLFEFFLDHPKEKILTLSKAALIMYFLFMFIDQIPGITSQLLGGSALSNNASTPGAMKMFNNTAGLLRGIQKRANRGAKSLGGATVDFLKEKGEKALDAYGNKGKSAKGPEEDAGDRVGNQQRSSDNYGNNNNSWDNSDSSQHNYDETDKDK